MLNQKVRLRAGNQYIIPKIQTVQGDTGRVLVCEIEDFDIPGGVTATFWAMKPSGKSVQNDAPFSDQSPFFGWTTPTGGCTITTDDPLEPIISADTAQTPECSYLLTGYIDGLRARNNETVIAALSNQVVALTQKSMEG